jgi:succinylglutamic semialdehyde dehydrogenase
MMEGFVERLKNSDLHRLISEEVGKPLWESKEEVAAMISKVAISIRAQEERAGEWSRGNVHVRHKPHGTLAVIGPFNFPGHLPNGHIVPALLAGNSVVFKPSELTPRVGKALVDLWQLPEEKLRLVQGGPEVGQRLATDPEINGLLFTGSHKTGTALARLFGNMPEKILALEMGGNTPLVVHTVDDMRAAAQTIILSAYVTSGQRCTCARRLIVTEEGAEVIDVLVEMTAKIRIGSYTDSPEPFMGPVINEKAANRVMANYKGLITRGGKPLVSMKQDGRFLTPGLVDVTSVVDRPDEEIFGPLLQLIRVKTLDAAIVEANNTRYGLAAGILSDNERDYVKFRNQVKAGVINWNNRTTGASSAAPFGGVGISGNHRPTALYSVDICNYPVASIEAERVTYQPHTGIDEGV